MAVTDVCWLVDEHPDECAEFWETEYPTMPSTRRDLVRAEAQGFRVAEHSVSPPRTWWRGFYTPLEERVAEPTALPNGKELLGSEGRGDVVA